MPGKIKMTQQALPAADGTFLAASATVRRYLRQLHFVNTTGAPITINFSISATFNTANALADGLSVAADSVLQLHFPGTPTDNTIWRAFGSATGCTLTATYEEEVV